MGNRKKGLKIKCVARIATIFLSRVKFQYRAGIHICVYLCLRSAVYKFDHYVGPTAAPSHARMGYLGQTEEKKDKSGYRAE